MKAAACIILAAAVLSFGQTRNKKVTGPDKPDTWQKSKECANQAEKVMADKSKTFTGWENHYSPKYNRCFVWIRYNYSGLDGAGKDFARHRWELIDAFERSNVADSEWDGPPALSCLIGNKKADCEKAKNFITEHVEN